MVIKFQHIPTVDFGLNVLKVVNLMKTRNVQTNQKKFENTELLALLDENSTFNATQAIICKRLYAIGMIQKEGKWLPRE